MRICKRSGCGNATDRSDGYCFECNASGRNKYAEDRKEKRADPFYTSAIWRRYSKWWRVNHPLCAVCGQPGQMVDHKNPIRNGGEQLDPENTQTMCFACHNRKTGIERSAKGQGGGKSQGSFG